MGYQDRGKTRILWAPDATKLTTPAAPTDNELGALTPLGADVAGIEGWASEPGLSNDPNLASKTDTQTRGLVTWPNSALTLYQRKGGAPIASLLIERERGQVVIAVEGIGPGLPAQVFETTILSVAELHGRLGQTRQYRATFQIRDVIAATQAADRARLWADAPALTWVTAAAQSWTQIGVVQ